MKPPAVVAKENDSTSGYFALIQYRCHRLRPKAVNRGFLSYCSGQQMFEFVTPAKAGVQKANPGQHWIPAFAGMTEISDFIVPDQ